MKRLSCPMNGERDISEFHYGGEYHSMPDPDCCPDEAWAEYVFFHENIAGRVIEWWCHVPSNCWFLAERDTRTDEVIRTFDANELVGNPGESSSPEGQNSE